MSVTKQTDDEAVTPAPGPCPPASVRGALETILASPGFAGSPQLSRFLRYLVDNTIAGDREALKETGIALGVFNRGPNYHPKADPIVRVEARRLRLRLDAFYAAEGLEEPVKITLPKGAYMPVFEAAPSLPAPPENPPPSPQRPRRLYWILAAALLAVLAAAWVLHRAGESGPAPRFWRALLDGEQPALVVVADSGLVMLQDMAGREATLQDYLSGRYVDQLAAGPVAGDDPRYAFGRRRYTAIADLTFALRLDRRPEASRHGVDVRYARDLRMHDLTGRCLILLGARQSNPWVELFEEQAAFRLLHDSASGDFRIVIRQPAPGEPSEIRVTPSMGQREVYGVISYHRNPRTTGWVLMVRGTSLTGTESAANLLFDDARLSELLRQATGPAGPRGFDILTRDRNLAGIPSHAEVAAVRIDAR